MRNKRKPCGTGAVTKFISFHLSHDKMENVFA